MVDKFTGHPKGYAYIEFADEAAANNALMLTTTTLRGRQIKVNHLFSRQKHVSLGAAETKKHCWSYTRTRNQQRKTAWNTFYVWIRNAYTPVVWKRVGENIFTIKILLSSECLCLVPSVLDFDQGSRDGLGEHRIRYMDFILFRNHSDF